MSREKVGRGHRSLAVLAAGAVTLGILTVVPLPASVAVPPVQLNAGAAVAAAPPLHAAQMPKEKDPAEDTSPLPDTVADLPDDSLSVVDPVAEWTSVPGAPLELRVDPDATPEELNPTPEPAADSGEMVVAPAVATSMAEDPAAVVDLAPVRVKIERPEDLGASVMLLSLEDGSAAGDLVTQGKPPPVEVRLDYSGFEQVFGGHWAQRLQVLAFPECYLTTPEAPECSQSTVVPFTKEIANKSVSFATLKAEKAVKDQADAKDKTDKDQADNDEVVDGAEQATEAAFTGSPAGKTSAFLPASNSGSIYSFTAGAGGYGASPFSQASEWQVGEGSGEFSHSYDFALPPSQGGAAPGLALSYSSGAVDGMSLAENGQASSAGVGWELSTSYITRAYMSCAKDGEPTWGDLCWRTRGSAEGLVEDLRIVLNGRASRLIPVSANSFRLQDDPGWKVERLRGTQGVDNPDNDNEGFKDRR